MKYYKLEVLHKYVNKMHGYLVMGKKHYPEAMESAFIKIVDEEDLTDDEVAKGFGMVIYVDEKTYAMAHQLGINYTGIVEEIPATASDYFDD